MLISSPYKPWRLKVFESCLKKSKDYRSFHKFSSNSQDHNFLNFWNFWVILFAKYSLRGLLHIIFENQEKILNGRSFLKRKDYRSFLESGMLNQGLTRKISDFSRILKAQYLNSSNHLIWLFLHCALLFEYFIWLKKIRKRTRELDSASA